MSWLKLDDQFPDHPKVAALSDAAFRCHVRGMAYCAEHLTDGFMPRRKAEEIAGACLPELIAKPRNGAPLWALSGGEYEIHDYLVYNPTRDEAERLRAERSAAGKLGGMRSAEARRKANATASATANRKQTVKQTPKQTVKQNSNPVPVPVLRTQAPIPKTLKNTCPPNGGRDRFDEFWASYPRKESKGTAKRAWATAAKKADPTAIIEGLRAYHFSDERQYQPMPATWLNGERWTDEQVPFPDMTPDGVSVRDLEAYDA
jgi:hypothetical protein